MPHVRHFRVYPAIPRERIRQIGNAAGTGAGLMLLSVAERQDAEELSEQIHYLELARHKRFIRLFAEGQRFPGHAINPPAVETAG